jgi:pimeloyl-ACP methyl ester carboxylesterase
MTENILSKTIKVNGRDVHYYTAGQGDPLIVVHGGGGDARTWLDNAAVLSRKYTIYIPDLPGFGASQLLDGEYSIPELAEFVNTFADKLGLGSFYLVGHSIGGGVALNYALKSPHKIKKLVLVSSLCLGKEIALWVRLASILARGLSSAILAAPRVMKWLAKTPRFPVELVRPAFRASVNLGSTITTLKEQTLVLGNRLSEILMPTLVVWAAKDNIVPAKQAYAAAEVIPRCQLKVFQDCGHSVYRDKICEFPQLLTGFLG